MSEDSMAKEAEQFTRVPPSEEASPNPVTGYYVETDRDGRTHITLTLRKGGTVPLHDLDPMQALLYLDLLSKSGPTILAIWDPESNKLQWRMRSNEDE